MSQLKRNPVRQDIHLGLNKQGRIVLVSPNGSEIIAENGEGRLKEIIAKQAEFLRHGQSRATRIRAGISATRKNLAEIGAIPVIRLLMYPLLALWKKRLRRLDDELSAARRNAADTGTRLLFRMNPESAAAYEAMAQAFLALDKAKAVWALDVPVGPGASLDRLQLEEHWTREPCSVEHADHPVLQANGVSFVIRQSRQALHVFPFFILLEREDSAPEIFPICGMSFQARDVIYVEDEPVPEDAVIVSHGDFWEGSGRRMKKRKLPVICYGSVRLGLSGERSLTLMSSGMVLVQKLTLSFYEFGKKIEQLCQTGDTKSLMVLEGATSPGVIGEPGRPATDPPEPRWFPGLDLALVVALVVLLVSWNPFPGDSVRPRPESTQAVSSLSSSPVSAPVPPPVAETAEPKTGMTAAIPAETPESREMPADAEPGVAPAREPLPPRSLSHDNALESSDPFEDTDFDASLKSTQSASIIVNRANIRQHPSLDSGIIATLDRGESLDVLSIQGDWALVSSGRFPIGWIHRDLIRR